MRQQAINAQSSKSFDINTIFSLAPRYRLLILLGLFLLIFLIGYIISIRPQTSQMTKEQRQERSLKQNFESKFRYYSKLKKLDQENKILQTHYTELLNQLPPKSKVEQLLEHITKIGATEGLKFVFFRPKEEQEHGFYADIPIKVAILGRYHQIALFLSKLANLKQLITIHNFNLERAKLNQDILTMHMTLKVYRQITPSKQEKK